MLIKQATLEFKPGHKNPAMYFLIGQDHFQLNSFAQGIIKTWHQCHQEGSETRIMYISSPADWVLLEEEASSYSLFSDTVLLDVRYDKKTIDAAGKTFLQNYIEHVNPRCLILFRTPELPLKQLQAFVNEDKVHIVLANTPDIRTIKNWIGEQLRQLALDYDPQIPTLIYQYNQGNLLACSQIIEKLGLTADKDKTLGIEEVREQLIYQSNHPLYDLATACLEGNTAKALELVQQAFINKTEATLVLWILTQEVRLLLQLLHLLSRQTTFRDAASQLKIWSSKINSYQSAIKKYKPDLLNNLIQHCNTVDKQIKSNQNKQVWHSLEYIALSLCSGQQAGCLE